MPIDHLQKIARAPDIDTLRGFFLDAMKGQGFENAFYTARFLAALPSQSRHHQDVLITNIPKTMQQEMLRPRAGRTPQWAEWVDRNDGTISFRDLRRTIEAVGASRPPEFEIARHHGLGAVQVVSLRGQVMRWTGAVLLNPRLGATPEELDALWRERGREAVLICRVAHLRLATIPRNSGQPLLTPRQREVLEWRSAGKTVGEIATIIGVTPATVEKHMRLAREALGAQTTAQAILRAHVAHELFPRVMHSQPLT
ncbi:helix-turn-helix transcriptional regulator [Paracoccus sp. NSM]|uniref:helix-turn-helix transcriptional regulator n=1 Tax=Paracoccus sp. NSM TaxID=3457784 RepID=UPI0040370CE1